MEFRSKGTSHECDSRLPEKQTSPRTIQLTGSEPVHTSESVSKLFGSVHDTYFFHQDYYVGFDSMLGAELTA